MAPVTAQTFAMPGGFGQGLRPLLASSGALGAFATGLPNPKTISFSQLNEVPRLVGPLLDIGVEPSGPPLTGEELTGYELYARLDSSSFEGQRAFLQGLAGRGLPDTDSLDRNIGSLLDCEPHHSHTEFRRSLMKAQLATNHFARALLFSRSEEYGPKDVADDLREASGWYVEANLYGAAAIVDSVKLNISGNGTVRMKDSVFASALFKHALEDMNGELLSGVAYLYGLYYAKKSETWGTMQTLFMISGIVHERHGMIDEAVKAYEGSLWAFSRQRPVQIDKRDMAVAALQAVGRFRPEFLSDVSDLIGQLTEARALTGSSYVPSAMSFELAASIATESPEAAAHFAKAGQIFADESALWWENAGRFEMERLVKLRTEGDDDR